MFGLFYLVDKSGLALSFEGDIVIAYLEDDAPQTPNIGPAIIPLGAISVFKNLRALIEERANVLDDAPVDRVASDSEVTDLHSVLLTFEEYIAGFEVSVYDLLRMQVVYSKCDLDNESLDSML